MKTLYKTDQKGKTRIWRAQALNGSLHTTHGTKEGKQIVDIVDCHPKNIGRSNETTAEQQAKRECVALYIKKLTRDGYREDENTVPASAIIRPTLARDYTKLSHQMKGQASAWLSPKLDGVRAIWIPELKKFQSRKGTYYDTPELEALMHSVQIPIDGELYAHDTPLNRIVSEARKPKGLIQLEFRAFDVVGGAPFFLRQGILASALGGLDPRISAVPQQLEPLNMVATYHDKWVAEGYEGVMIRRDVDAPYEQGIRSANLYKYKEFLEREFEVVGVKTDKTGQGVLTCKTRTGELFDCRCRGTDASRIHQVENPEDYIGMSLTVRYFTETEFGKPQFPIGITFRHDT
jgi:ATP-dependent DNA ligase